MKKLSTKESFALICMLYLGMFCLQGCQKEMQINNLAGANDNLDLVQSKIIYTDIIPNVTEKAKTVYDPYHDYYLDLNNNDTTDFVIEAYYVRSGMFAPPVCGVTIISLKKNRVACDSLASPLAMNPDDLINSNLNWASGGVLRGIRPPNNYLFGNWTTTTDHYLGLKIKSGSNTYYGWVRLSVSVSPSPPLKSSVTIKDYAYNGIPNQRILAGQMK